MKDAASSVYPLVPSALWSEPSLPLASTLSLDLQEDQLPALLSDNWSPDQPLFPRPYSVSSFPGVPCLVSDSACASSVSCCPSQWVLFPHHSFHIITGLLSPTRGSAIGPRILTACFSYNGFISSAWESSLPWSLLIFHISLFLPHSQLSHLFHQGSLYLHCHPQPCPIIESQHWEPDPFLPLSYNLNAPSSTPILYLSSCPLECTHMLDPLLQPDSTTSHGPFLSGPQPLISLDLLFTP